MSGITDTNIVLGQGSAIKQVHNVGRQALELNQQFVAQKAEDKEKEDKSKVQNFEAGNRIEVKGYEEKKNRKEPKYDEKGSQKEKPKEDSDLPEERLIDIKV